MSLNIPATLRFGLIALLALLATDRAIYFAGAQLIAGSPNRFAQLYHGELAADLLILGNSRADAHFDPVWIEQELGVRAVNLGLGGNHMVLNAILLEDYLTRHPAPETLIVEITSLTVIPEDMGDFLVFVPASRRLRALAEKVTPRYALAGAALQGLWLNNDMFLRMARETLRPEARRIGARAGTHRMEPEVRELILPILETPAANLAALARIRAVAEEAGIRLIPVVAPFAMPPENIQGLEDFLAKAGKVLGPHAILDYSAALQDPGYFSDPTHLNVEGLLAFSQRIFLEDRSLDPES